MPCAKTAVSLPAALLERADRVARKEKIPRSRLFARALEQFLQRNEGEDLTDQINEVYSVYPHGIAPEDEPLLRGVRHQFRKVMERDE